MKTYGILTAALVGAGLTMGTVTSASAADIFGHRQGTRTIIHEEIDEPRAPAYGFRDIRFGDVDQGPRYRTRRVVREIYEYEDDDDLDD